MIFHEVALIGVVQYALSVAKDRTANMIAVMLVYFIIQNSIFHLKYHIEDQVD